MSIIRKFEDILIWQKSRKLVENTYKITNLKSFRNDFTLKDQMRRSIISVMLNISEGFARKTNNEFKKFLHIAHGSIAEFQSTLYIALDQKYIYDHDFIMLYNKAEEISKMITGLIKYLRKRKIDGSL